MPELRAYEEFLCSIQRVSYALSSYLMRNQNCKGPHTKYAANVGSKRDLISQKKKM